MKDEQKTFHLLGLVCGHACVCACVQTGTLQISAVGSISFLVIADTDVVAASVAARQRAWSTLTEIKGHGRCGLSLPVIA